MTISPLLIYGINTLSALHNLSRLLILAILLLSLITFFHIIIDEPDEPETSKKILKINFKVLIALLALVVFVPCKSTMYEMLIIPTVVNSPTIQQLPAELQKYINQTLEIKEKK